MKIQELRVGNYVRVKYFAYNELDTHNKITGITEEHPFVNTIVFDYLEYDEIEPIPLTEEWLLKFGFEIEFDDPIKHARIGNNPVNRDSILKLTNCDADLENGIWFYRNGFHKIKHVNQLQNLYFALTGQELCEAK